MRWKAIKSLIGRLVIRTLFLLVAVFFLTVQVPFLVVHNRSGTLFYKRPIGVGDIFVLRYIHSVEQTPVEDEYRISGGKIWQWEERIRSHNAGLPTEAPLNGRFISGHEWMHVRGGRSTFPNFRYRVGNDFLGKNVLIVSHTRVFPLYQMVPGSLIFFSVEWGFLSGISFPLNN